MVRCSASGAHTVGRARMASRRVIALAASRSLCPMRVKVAPVRPSRRLRRLFVLAPVRSHSERASSHGYSTTTSLSLVHTKSEH